MPYRRNIEDKSNIETKLQKPETYKDAETTRSLMIQRTESAIWILHEVSCHGRDKFSHHTRDVHIHCDKYPGEHEWVPASEEMHSLTLAIEETTLATDNKRNLGSERSEAGEGETWWVWVSRCAAVSVSWATLSCHGKWADGLLDGCSLCPLAFWGFALPL